MVRKIHFLLKYSFIAICSSHHGNPEGPAKTTWGICSKMRSYTSVTKSDMDQKTTVQMILQTGHHHNKPPLQPTEESHERVSREFKNVKQKRSHLFNSWILTRVGPFNRKMILSTLRNGWKRKNGMKYLNPFKCRGIWNQYCLQKPTKHTKCMHVCKAISI